MNLRERREGVIPAKAYPACASAAGTGELVEGGGNLGGKTPG